MDQSASAGGDPRRILRTGVVMIVLLLLIGATFVVGSVDRENQPAVDVAAGGAGAGGSPQSFSPDGVGSAQPPPTGGADGGSGILVVSPEEDQRRTREQIEAIRRQATERRAERKRAADADAAVWTRTDEGSAIVSFKRLVPLTDLGKIITAPGIKLVGVSYVADVPGPDSYGQLPLGNGLDSAAEEAAILHSELTKQLGHMQQSLATAISDRDRDDLRRSIAPTVQRVGALAAQGPAAITTTGMFVHGPLVSIGSLRAHPDVALVERAPVNEELGALPPPPYDLPDVAR